MAGAVRTEARTHAITEFLLSALGHKLRTPLSVISNECYVLSKSVAGPEVQKISEKSREISTLLTALEEVFKRRSNPREINFEDCLRGAFEGLEIAIACDGALRVPSDGTWEQVCAGIGQLCRVIGASAEIRLSQTGKIDIEFRGMRIQSRPEKGTLLCAVFCDLFLPVLACIDVLMLSAAVTVEVTRETDRAGIYIQVKDDRST